MKMYLVRANVSVNVSLSIFACLVLLALVSNVHAVSDNTNAKPNASLQTLLNASIESVMGVTEWPCEFTGVFTQKRKLSGLKTSLDSSGEFFYSCTHGLLWEVRKPITESVVYTSVGKHLRIRPGGSTRELTGVVQKRIAALLLGLLGGDAAALERDFAVSKDAAQSGSIVLRPRTPALQQQIESIELLDDQHSIYVRINSATTGDMDIRISDLRLQESPPVVACAALSQQADLACRHLFDSR